MAPGTSAGIARRRARLLLAGLAAGLVVVVALALLIAESLTAHPPALSGPDDVGVGPWDWASETALASRPMPYLPLAAAYPQTLAADPGPAPLRLPAASSTAGWIASGFPATPEGAVAQLAVLTTQGMRGGDPEVYQRAYNQFAAPGAPNSSTAKLTSVLTQLRATAHLDATGPVTDLSVSWAPAQGLIKGVLDQGRYAVVCVLGELTTSYQYRPLLSLGTGDCQAMRWLPAPASPTGGVWRISPGAAAALSPDAWPGSQDSINAGFREITR